MDLTRRTFLRSMLIAPMMPLAFDSHRALSSPAEQESTPVIRSGEWVQSIDAFVAGERSGLAPSAVEGGLTLNAAGQPGSYFSPVLRADYPFNATALIWRCDLPEETSLALSVRLSKDGQQWGDWIDVTETIDLQQPSDRHPGELVLASGQYVQWSARLRSAGAASPVLREVKVVYIDSMQGPKASDVRAEDLVPASGAAVSAPSIISRAGWGCPEPYSSPRWPPEYERVYKIVIHHTAHAATAAESNSYTDGAAIVRAIWQYHANSLGWGDIGYNYLVDRFGYVYQGRFGGDDVIGGHALQWNHGSAGISIVGDFRYSDVPWAAQDSLSRLCAWVAHRRDIHPLSQSYFIDRTTYNICGHKDLNTPDHATECPGAYLYSRIPAIRQQVWSYFPDYGDGWLGENTPGTLEAGQTVAVNLSVINRGRLTWPVGGSNPVHAGYHWYRADGSEYSQSASEDHRTPLPSDLPYGYQTNLTALLTAPHDPGTYTLKWDMVHEWVTWFAWQGCTTLNKSISVPAPQPALSIGNQTWFRFLADAETNPGPQVIPITNTGGGTLTWTATVDQGWCHLSAGSGQAPYNLLITVDKSGLSAGTTYEANITISADKAVRSPQYLHVTFIYSAEPLRHDYLPGVFNGGGH